MATYTAPLLQDDAFGSALGGDLSIDRVEQAIDSLSTPGVGDRVDPSQLSSISTLRSWLERDIARTQLTIDGLQGQLLQEPNNVVTTRNLDNAQAALGRTVTSYSKLLGIEQRSNPQAAPAILTQYVDPQGNPVPGYLRDSSRPNAAPIRVPQGLDVYTEPGTGQSFLQTPSGVIRLDVSPDTAAQQAGAAEGRTFTREEREAAETFAREQQRERLGDNAAGRTAAANLQRELLDFQAWKLEEEAKIKAVEFRLREGEIDARRADTEFNMINAPLERMETRLRDAIGVLKQQERNDLDAWTHTQDFDKDIFVLVTNAITAANTRESQEDIARASAGTQQATTKMNFVRDMALKATELYKQALEHIGSVPQAWIEAYQKGMVAIAQGRTVPHNWMQGVAWPTAVSPDPMFLQKQVASWYGTTPENPLPPDFVPQFRDRQALPVGPAGLSPEDYRAANPRPEPRLPEGVTDAMMAGALARPNAAPLPEDYQTFVPGAAAQRTTLQITDDGHVTSPIGMEDEGPTLPDLNTGQEEEPVPEATYETPSQYTEEDMAWVTDLIMPVLAHVPQDNWPNLINSAVGVALGEDPRNEWSADMEALTGTPWLLDDDYEDSLRQGMDLFDTEELYA